MQRRRRLLCLLTGLALGACSAPADAPTEALDELAGVPNKFGVGLTEAGNDVLWNRIQDLAGPRGWGLIICAELNGQSPGASGGCRNGVRGLASRGINIIVRLGPPWGDRRIRNDADPGSNHRRYTNLAQRYRLVVQDLLQDLGTADVRLAVQIANEINLCYEWMADPGTILTAQDIAAEAAGLHRDVGDALAAINDPRLAVVTAALAPGGTARCEYRGGSSDSWPICPSSGSCFVPGSTSVAFLQHMRAAVPGVFGGGRFDGFGSHPYPASGLGHSFFVPFEQASLGLHVYRQELNAAGVRLPVYITETGWPTQGGPRTYTSEEIGDMTVQAYLSSDPNNLGWMRDPEVAAVAPYVLNHTDAWDRFAYLDRAQNPRAQFHRIKAARCEHHWSAGCPNPPPPTNLPDVLIEDITSVPSNPRPGDAVVFNVRVRNAGTAATGPTVGVAYFVDGQYVGFGSTGALGAGQTSTQYALRQPWTAQAGTFQIRAVVDDVNRFQESNEDNNARIESLTVGGAPPPPTGPVRKVRCDASGGCPVHFGTDLAGGQVLGTVAPGTQMGVYTQSGTRLVVSYPMADRGFAVQYVDLTPGVWTRVEQAPNPGTPPSSGASANVTCQQAAGCDVLYGANMQVNLQPLGHVPCGTRMGVFLRDSRPAARRYVVSYMMADRDYTVQMVPIDGGAWTTGGATCGGPPPPTGNLLDNGDFGAGTQSWTTWNQRGSMAVEAPQGGLRLAGNDVNGGVFQAFTLPATNQRIRITGRWRTDPSRPQAQWAEISVIDGPRTPRPGEDVRADQSDVTLAFKNDTWASPGGWDGTLAAASPVTTQAEVVVAGDRAALVIKMGNVGGGATGIWLDDLVVEVVGSAPPPPPTPPQIGGPPAAGCANAYDFGQVRQWAQANNVTVGLPKIGFHVGPGGNPTGLGEMMRCLDAAGLPFFLKSADAAGPLFEAQQLRAASGVPHVLVYRRSVACGTTNCDVPNYFTDPVSAARAHWQVHRDLFPPELDPNVVWLETINEIDKNRSDWLGRFAAETSRLALRDGFRWAAFGWSSGEPEPSHWDTPGMVEFLTLAAQNPTRLAVALHEYSLDTNDLAFGYPFRVGRFRQLFAAADARGLRRPTVLITEFGWSLNDLPGSTEAISQLDWASRDYAPYPEILGAAIWYLGPGFGGIANRTQPLIAPLTTYSLQNYYVVP